MPAALSADVWATIAFSASSVLLGFGLPLAAGLAVIGLVRGFVENSWRLLVLGMLLTVGLVAAGVLLRTWGAGSAAASEALAAANATAALVFTAVTPPGVVLGVLLVVVALGRRYIGGAWERRRRGGVR
jgi:uncharacterized membrane protein